MKLRWSSKALSDLADIRDYSVSEWGHARAARYAREIKLAALAAARAPMRAAPADRYRLGYRKVTIGSHMIFFKVSEDSIEIARVLHSAMDSGKQLDDQF
jgi:toxin ParE1/3/4